ncbi:hypothetical protein IPU53_14080 [Bacillus sp. SD088]|nr:hypothetical protein [Bacillus sp. SD088]
MDFIEILKREIKHRGLVIY